MILMSDTVMGEKLWCITSLTHDEKFIGIHYSTVKHLLEGAP